MKKQLNFLEKIKRFFSPLFKNSLVYIKGILIYFIWGFDKVVHVLFLERIIHYLELGLYDQFYFIIKLYLLYIFVYLIIQIFFRKSGWTEISDTAEKYIQNIYLKKYVHLDNNHIEKYGTGKLTAIINNGIERWGRLLDMFLGQSLNVIISFIFTGFMLYKSNNLFLVGFVLIYFFIYIGAYYLNLGALKSRRKRRDNGNLHTKNLVKVIMNKQEILQSDKINHELEILDFYKDKEIFYNKKTANYLLPLFEGPNIILSVIIVTLLAYLGNSYIEGNITISGIVGVVSALIIMKSAVEKGIEFFKNFTKDFVDVERLWEFFDNSPSLERYNFGNHFIYKKGDIKLENISYSYVKGKYVLNNFNMEITGGDIIALVGNSGSGKSTIAKLISGYIQYGKGKITIDNQELNKTSLKSYYKNIGYLTQEPSVFDGTVLENLSYAIDNQVSEKKLEEIINMAKCEFIYELPNGIDTEIGERGIKLSGGQRQRLAIAKILLKDPKIIILDEPTSALDSFSEEQITKAMNSLFKDRTVVVIAHRLQTVKNADKIFVIDSGNIVEVGTHKELIKKKGIYNRMLELQSGF